MSDPALPSPDLPSSILEPDYEIRINGWISRFPYDQYCASHAPEMAAWMHIVDVAALEQYKQRLRETFGAFKEVPADVFLMAKGEPRRRDVTKVCGLPYRPAGLAWPKTPDGEPMGFVAQFRFAESRDHVKSIPSDILLVFVSTPDPYDGDCTDQFYFEWHPLGLVDLATERNVPPPMFEFAPCYGVRHRTTCISEPSVIDYVERRIQDQRPGIFHARELAEYLCHVGTTKIGGIPFFGDRPTELPGRFICSLKAIYVPGDVEYPWINHPAPVGLWESSGPEFEMTFGDTSMLSFFLDDADKVHVFLEFA